MSLFLGKWWFNLNFRNKLSHWNLKLILHLECQMSYCWDKLHIAHNDIYTEHWECHHCPDSNPMVYIACNNDIQHLSCDIRQKFRRYKATSTSIIRHVQKDYNPICLQSLVVSSQMVFPMKIYVAYLVSCNIPNKGAVSSVIQSRTYICPTENCI